MTRDSDDANPSPDERLKTARLPIPQMNCPWNARRAADALQRVEGVVETSLVPRSDTVVVRYDPTRTSEPAITATVESTASAGDRESTRRRSGRRSGGCRCGCRDRSR